MGATLRVGILAGETSGDILGSGLMQALRERHPDISFDGVGGPLMEAQGLHSRVPMERLAVMGLVEPLKRLPELLRIRRELVQEFLRNPPDVFIGIDSPDFNLGVEARLRARGIRTVHYVSPSVWAWRQRRIHKIARAVDLVLTLLPFEAEFYRKHAVPVCFVGHPLADLIPLEPDRNAARALLALPPQARVLALLPGSRQGEVARLAPVFLAAAQRLLAADPRLQVLVPCASRARRAQLDALVQTAGMANGRLTLLDGQSREAMTAADAVILASGTAALEALLLKRPMLVCYRMAPLSYWIISRMLRVPYFSLPNLLAGRQLVEELVQEQVTAQGLVERATRLLDGREQAGLQQTYHDIHQQLRQDASRRATDAILEII
ncbi:MAG: lipid-A-disaccharide synthase [Pseudohongiellaceae bacterium]